jgi:hypothetical protein
MRNENMNPASEMTENDGEDRKLGERIVRVKGEQHCVRRVVSLLALFGALNAAGLVYAAVLVENFPYGSHRTITILSELGLASLICLLVLLGVLLGYRGELKRLRKSLTNRLDGQSFVHCNSSASQPPGAVGCDIVQRSPRGKPQGDQATPDFGTLQH